LTKSVFKTVREYSMAPVRLLWAATRSKMAFSQAWCSSGRGATPPYRATISGKAASPALRSIRSHNPACACTPPAMARKSRSTSATARPQGGTGWELGRLER